jgi:GlpG protein
MFWVFDVGGDMERQEGKIFFGVFIAVVGAVCNTLQFLVSGPYFEGMSGVVYGMIGYVWMMTRYQHNSRYSMSDGMMLFMVAWIVVGLMFDDLRIANTQHITGILMGLGLGSWRSGHFKTTLRRMRRR